MVQLTAPTVARAPTWVVVAGSVAICFHLGAVGINVLAARSGPWPAPDGANFGEPPAFAQDLNGLAPTYLALLKINPNYHFESNRPGVQGIYFVAHVKDRDGKVLATVRVPGPDANPWVRYREARLAQGLGQDLAFTPPQQGDVLTAPGQEAKTVEYWNMTAPHTFQLKKEPEHLVPRNRPVFQPSPWSLMLARSYARYLCRVHGGAAVEIVRHSKDVIPPNLISQDVRDLPPPDAFDENTGSFGELQP